MRRLCLLSALLAVFTTTASATTVVIDPNRVPMMLPAGGQQVRVSVGFNLFMSAPIGNSEQALKAQESGRRMIYDLAARECGLLREMLASECRLENVNVNVQHFNGNGYQGRQEGYTINGNVTFRIRQKPDGSAAPAGTAPK